MAYYVNPWTDWVATTNASSLVTYQVKTAVWGQWNGGVTTSGTTSLQIWDTWAHQYQATGTTLATQTWGYWNQHELQYQNLQYPAYVPPPPLTEEQLAVRRAAQREADRKVAERHERLVTAKARARALLLDHLDPVQKRDYEEKGSFRVEVGNRTFQINPGTHGNVKEIHLQDGREIVIRSFCIPSRRGDVPEPDVHLAQKLMLEGGEDSFRDFHRIANVTNYRPDLALQAA